MNRHFLVVLAAMLGIAGLLISTSRVWTQERPARDPRDRAAQAADRDGAAEEGVQVMTRGPVHEAYAEPVIRGPRPTPVLRKRPPDPIDELPPEEKPADQNAVWIPGYWAWDDDRNDFLWVSGVWRVPPPGRQWVPGHWTQVEEGSWQWVPGLWAVAGQTEVEYLPEPPDPVQEAVAQPPDETSVYVPGCWVWVENRHRWRPGHWIEYRPGWLWVSPCYVWSPAGYVFVDGYWDYPLRERGLLFAPVVVDPQLWARPGWAYRPRYLVYADFLLGAFFVRPDYHHYYFGDYFEPRYVDRGFVPWVDFRVGRQSYDPLFSYYRWSHRDDPRWVRDLNQLYVTRREDQAARPPRTLVQQQRLIQNIPRNAPASNIRNITAVAALNQVDKNMVRLQPVPANQVRQVHEHAIQLRQAGLERSKIETRLVSQGRPAAGKPQAPRRAALALPKAPALAAPEGAKAPPPLPKLPQPLARPAEQPRPAERPGERPRPGAQRPPTEQPRPGSERPPTERPRPGTERPPVERPRPGTERPPVERPRPDLERPPAERPQPGKERPPAERPRPPQEHTRIPAPAPSTPSAPPTARPAQERPVPVAPAQHPPRPEPRPTVDRPPPSPARPPAAPPREAPAPQRPAPPAPRPPEKPAAQPKPPERPAPAEKPTPPPHGDKKDTHGEKKEK